MSWFFPLLDAFKSRFNKELFQSAAAKQELVGLCPGDPDATLPFLFLYCCGARKYFSRFVNLMEEGRIELGACQSYW